MTPGVRVAKRAIDIAGSLVGLTLTLPLYPIIGAAIYLESPGPIFYKQRRAGMLLGTEVRDGMTYPHFVEFYMRKFRTMRVDAEKLTGPVLAQQDGGLGVIRLRVPGSLTYRHLALRVVAAACKMVAPRRAESGSLPLSEDEEEFEAQTVSAVGEAFNNIAIHGYNAGLLGDVDIEIESDEDGIIIRLMDSGQSFDPMSIESPPLDDLPESGMGLFIIKSFMNEVDYCPGSPNVLRLAKRRGGGSCLAGRVGGDEEEHTDASFSETAKGHPTSSFRMRSVSRSSATRAAGGTKNQ